MRDRPDVGIFFGRPGRSRTLAEHLRARGFPVTLYGDEGVPGTFVPVPYSFARALPRLLSTRHDVYLTGLSFLPSVSLYVNRLLRGRPYVFNATGLKSRAYRDRARRWMFPRTAERWLYPALMRRVLAGAAWIVCNSRFLLTQLATEHPAYAAKMVTVYNGIDFERYAIADAGARPPRRLVSVVTWNYGAKAGAARLLVDAMGPITARYPDARLVIAAKVSHRRYAEAIERHVATVPWAGSITIVYNATDVPGLLLTGDLFLYASGSDSLPRALVEAQAAGLAVVTTATAGCPEVVEDSVTGFVTPSDAGALAARAIELLGDAGTRRTFGRRGRERVREVFSWARMADAYAELFVRTASGRASLARAPRVAES